MPATDPDFVEWKHEVNRLLFLHFSLTLDDLPDMLTRDAFDSGQTPDDFYENEVREVLVEEFGAEMVEELWPKPFV